MGVLPPFSLQADELDELIALQKKVHALEGVGRYQDAIPFAQQSLMIAEKAFANNPKNLAIATNDLAILYKAMGNNTQTKPRDQRSLKVREMALGPDHPDVAQSLNNLGNLYNAQGRYREAEPLLERSIAMGDRDGSSPRDGANSDTARALLGWLVGRREMALADLRTAMKPSR